MTYPRLIHGVMIVIGLVGQALLVQTADYGGALVYKHGVAVLRPQEITETKNMETAQKESPAATTGAPTILKDSVNWKISEGSEKQLKEHLQAHEGSIDGIKASTEQIGDKTFLVLEKNSAEPLLLTFKPIMGDVQVEAEVDASEFNGTVSLVHHVNHPAYDYFSISRDGQTELGRFADNKKQVFGNKTVEINGVKKIKAVSAGAHFRGYVDGKLTVHGHDKAAAPGQSGFHLSGTGRVRIAEFYANPIKE